MKKDFQHNKISKIRLFLCTLCFCSVFCFCAPQAQATWFLDSISNLLQKVDAKIKKTLGTEQNVTATILEWLNSRILAGSGQESLDLYDEIAKDSFNLAKDISNGQYNISNFSLDSVLNSLVGQIDGFVTQQGMLQKMLEDTIKAEEKKKLDKKSEMQKELVILESQREALDALEATEERQAQMDELDKRIAELHVAIRENDEQDVLNTNSVKNIKGQMSVLGAKLEALNKQLSEKKLLGMLETESMKLFKLKDDKDDSDSGAYEAETYEDLIERIFLKEDEIANSKNVKRIMNERKKEFYDAVISALEMQVKTIDDIEKTNERSQACTDTSVETADTVFGAMGLRQCVELQNSLAAVGYLDIMLATIRLELTEDLQKWDNKYKLLDYNKDMSKFNLDDYMLREEDLLVKLKKQVKGAIKSYNPLR